MGNGGPLLDPVKEDGARDETRLPFTAHLEATSLESSLGTRAEPQLGDRAQVRRWPASPRAKRSASQLLHCSLRSKGRLGAAELCHRVCETVATLGDGHRQWSRRRLRDEATEAASFGRPDDVGPALDLALTRSTGVVDHTLLQFSLWTEEASRSSSAV